MPADAQVHLRGQVEYLHKLVAASHIYDTWTTKGSDAAALADRFMDGSIDMLDQFMTAPGCATIQSSDTGNADAQKSCLPLHQSETPSSPQHTVCETHSADNVSPALVQQHQGMQSRDVLHQNAAAGQHQNDEVAVLHMDNLSYQQFVENFMQPNLPVMIQGLAEGWRATKEWVSASGSIDMDALAQHFGQAQVWVSDTTRVNSACAPRLDMTVAEFGEWWQMHKAGKDARLLYLKDWHFVNEFPHYKAYGTPHYFQEDWLNEFYDMKQALKRQQQGNTAMTAQPGSALQSEVDSATQSAAAETAATQSAAAETAATQSAAKHSATIESGKDGQRAVLPLEALLAGESTGYEGADREHGCSEQTPACSCQSDSASSQHDVVSSDYRFVYLGCKDTWTPLHADVLRSYSWSTNVAGRKHWKLLPPEYTHLLYDRFGREMAASFDLAESDGRDRFPNLDQACQHVVECIQETGETLFVPSGWHHTVHNLEDTLSINHNWLNGYNIHWAWALLQQEHSDATAAIEDCREGCSAEEFEGLVQRNMAANCGMDYAFMADFMKAILSRDLNLLRSCGENGAAHRRHKFSATRARWVLAKLQQELEDDTLLCWHMK